MGITKYLKINCYTVYSSVFHSLTLFTFFTNVITNTDKKWNTDTQKSLILFQGWQPFYILFCQNRCYWSDLHKLWWPTVSLNESLKIFIMQLEQPIFFFPSWEKHSHTTKCNLIPPVGRVYHSYTVYFRALLKLLKVNKATKSSVYYLSSAKGKYS